MYNLQPLIEQLDLAASLLKEDSPMYARLALMLVDNTVELLSHTECERMIMFDRERGKYADREFSQAEEQAALGQHFDEKVRFLSQHSKLEESERDFMLRAHLLRNECYHTGLKHERIIWSVAYEYHEFACILFARFSPGFFMLMPQGPISDAFKRHCSDAHELTSDDKLASVADSLCSARPARKEPLGTVLSNSACRQIDEIECNLEFLANDGFQVDDIDEVIRLTLFYQTSDHDSLKEGLDVRHVAGFRELHRRVKNAEARYTTAISRKSIQRWRDRALSLTKESDVSGALVKYTDLRRDYLQTKDLIDEAAYALDRDIQLQIDIARGK